MSREFFQPKTLNEALEYRRNREGAALLAGGTDLVVAINKQRSIEGDIIDLSKIKELREIYIEEDKIKIGAMATFTSIIESEILKERARILCQAAETVGSPQIRNRGTIGGNICNASPAADAVPALICLEAKVELESMNAEGGVQKRELALEEFITGAHATLLRRDEILTYVEFKLQTNDTSMKFKKIGRRNALAVSRLNGACILNMNNGLVSDVKLVLGAATSKPERFTLVENYLNGRQLDEEVLKKAGILASDYVLKQTGGRSSSSYKLPVVARFVESILKDTLNKEE